MALRLTSAALLACSFALFPVLSLFDFAKFFLSVLGCILFAYAFAQQRNRQRDQLLQLSTEDPLTGAGNRRALNKKLDQLVATYRRTAMPMSAILLDLDNFKAINDAQGHATGDAVLRCVCDTIGARIRLTDSLLRFGGDEFVVLASGGAPLGGVNIYGNGFLPAVHQASFIDPTQKEPLANITPREADGLQRKRLRFVERLDRGHLARLQGDEQVESAIQNYEIAYRMQSAVPDLVDLRGESEATKQLYGLDSPVKEKAEYARQCLLARRLVERGVRFIELTCLPRPSDLGQIGNPWDQHGVLKAGHSEMAFQVDQPIAGLIKDLKARGLFDETLIVWAGEFGRTPFAQSTDGRDHNPFGFSVWLAGGGIKGGTAHGATDELGYHAVQDVCTVYDLWATVLHLLGMDHEKLTYRFGGRDFRLTDVHGQVVKAVLT